MAIDARLRIGSSAASDVSLTSDGISIIEYPMETPAVDQGVLHNLGDGDTLSIPSWANVTERLKILIQGATAGAIRDKVRAIERGLDMARQGTMDHLDDRLYLRVEFDHDATPWRSQVLAARLEHDHITDQLWKNQVEANLYITRRYYWETEAIQPIAVSSGTTTTPTTEYAIIYNADDTHATQRNWAQIADSEVIGSVPAPLNLYVRNQSGSPRSAAAFYVGNYVFNNPTGVDPIFRHEDAATVDTDWVGSSEGARYRWMLTNGNLTESFRGQFGRILAVFSDRPASTTLVRAALQYREPIPTIDMALGEQVLTGTNQVVDLGGLPIPPGNTWANTGPLMALTVKAQAVDGDTMAIDWVQVMPSGAGRYRVARAISPAWSMAHNDELVDAGSDQEGAYTLVSGGSIPAFRPFFNPIYVWPERTQRLRVIVQGNTSMEAGQAWGVKAEYRPRRLTI